MTFLALEARSMIGRLSGVEGREPIQNSAPSELSPGYICWATDSIALPRCSFMGASGRAISVIERWRQDDNQVRPHSAHSGLTPDAAHRRSAGDWLRNPDQDSLL